jgi:hypothetical protein
MGNLGVSVVIVSTLLTSPADGGILSLGPEPGTMPNAPGGGRVRFRLSPHAQREAAARKIPPAVIEAVLESPQQVVRAHGGLRAYQSRVELRPGRTYLVRAIVAEAVDPPVVVTVYRTRKIAKYWREP